MTSSKEQEYPPPTNGKATSLLHSVPEEGEDRITKHPSKAQAPSVSASNDHGTLSSKTTFQSSREVPLVELTLENVTYAPITRKAQFNAKGSKSKQERTTVLHNISTQISPYKLTAWMGPSGSGKTSLLSVVADLIQPADLQPGSLITANGEEGRLPKRFVGVVWQDDLLLSNLTVEENIYFAARLKTPAHISDEDVRITVQEIMKEVGLLHVRDSLVGSPLMGKPGISGGERKRVAVACELVAKPSLLVLDEPTSGLDATTAQALINTLRELANVGHAIAVVIHQPRTAIFNSFDHLLLLSKGRVVFNGPSYKVRPYLEQCPSVSPLPPETGIADWLMDVLIEDEHRKEGPVLPQHWTDSIVAQGLTTPPSSTGKLFDRRFRMSSLSELNAAPKYNIGFHKQLTMLIQRTVKQQRGERLTATNAAFQFIYLVFTCLLWWRLPNNTDWVFERNSLFFFIIVAQANGIVVNAVQVFQQERTLLARERAKKMYQVLPYFVAKTVSDMTNNVLLPMLYGAIVYWTAGYRATGAAYFKFLLAYYGTLSAAQSMGLWVSIAIPSMQIALILSAPITLFFIIMGGFYVPFESMRPVIQWASWLSFARYGYSALIVNEYEGRDIPCAEGGDSTYGGVCPLPGDLVIADAGITGVVSNYWFNILMVLLLQVVFRVAAYIQLRRR